MKTRTLLLLTLSSFFQSFALCASITDEIRESISSLSSDSQEIGPELVQDFRTISLLDRKGEIEIPENNDEEPVLRRKKRIADSSETLESRTSQLDHFPKTYSPHPSVSFETPTVFEDLDSLFLLAEMEAATPKNDPSTLYFPDLSLLQQVQEQEPSDECYPYNLRRELTETVEDVMGIPRRKRTRYGIN